MRAALFDAAPKFPPGLLLELGGEITDDPEAFEACLLERRHEASVRQSRAAAERAGVRGTPTFFILTRNGEGDLRLSGTIRGAVPLEDFARALDRALAGAAASGGG